MSFRFVALAFGLLLATSATASDGLPLANTCRTARATVPVDSLVGQLATSPEHASFLADAGDGRLTAVRRKLNAMPHDEATRWRQSAMMFAVQAGQSDVVAALLDDGADANANALLPGYKQAFLSHALNPAILGAVSKGNMLNDHDISIGPALSIAASCGDPATVDALLRHHADVMARMAPNVADPLTVAVMQGNADIVQRLLDHNADACADDRHLHQRQRGFHTLAQLGQRAGLPADLTARLTCLAVASVH
ncbi:MAG: ankyrin repeat domain-containing protein [Rhodanobacter sp.]